MVTNKTSEAKPFSLSFFITTITVTLLLLFGLLALVAPKIWKVQLEAGWFLLLITFLIGHLFNSFGEYFFHRYVLHAPLIPGLAFFYKSHTKHHALTRVVPRPKGVENIYPITKEDQHENSFFPWYALAVFAALFTPIYAAAQWIFPSAPVFLGGYLSLAWTVSLYEILHAIEHWPLEKWKPLFDHPWFGRYFEKFYRFHLHHHADIKSNEAISGFFGIPIPDMVFGTLVDCRTLYEHGSQVDPQRIESPKPRRFILWLDRLVEEKKTKRRSA